MTDLERARAWMAMRGLLVSDKRGRHSDDYDTETLAALLAEARAEGRRESEISEINRTPEGAGLDIEHVHGLADLLRDAEARGRRQGLEEAARAMRDDGEDEGDSQYAIARRVERIRALAEEEKP